MRATIFRGAERPGLDLYWLDSVNQPVDFTISGTWTYAVTVTQNGVTTAFSGASVVANANPTADNKLSTDVPTLSMSFAAGSTAGLSVGPAVIHVAASSGGLNRDAEWMVEVR